MSFCVLQRNKYYNCIQWERERDLPFADIVSPFVELHLRENAAFGELELPSGLLLPLLWRGHSPARNFAIEGVRAHVNCV